MPTCVVTRGGRKGRAWLVREGTQHNRVVFMTDPDKKGRLVLKSECSQIKRVPAMGKIAAGKPCPWTATLTADVKELRLKKGDTVVITKMSYLNVRIAAQGVAERESLRVPRSYVTGITKTSNVVASDGTDIPPELYDCTEVEVDPRVLGQRLAEARKARGITQEDVADYLGCSRPTFIAVEKGQREAKLEEIVKLASYFGRRVSELVRPGEQLVDFQPHLRAVAEKMKPEDQHELLLAIGDLQRLAADYRELERLMNAPLRYNYPPQVSLDPRLDVVELAESVASGERRRLSLGEQPVDELRSILEWDVGLRVFYWPLPAAIAGMYAYADDLGGSIMVNRKHPVERRRATMLHEYGHLIADRYKPGIDYLNMPGRKPAKERFAEAFALSFLMPATAVRQRFHEIVTSTDDFQVADLCRLSHFFFASVEVMAIRLEQLGLIPKGSWALIKESRSAPLPAAMLSDLPAHQETPDYYPERYKYLAVHAFEKGKISQEQLAHFLHCDPVTARQIVTGCLTSNIMEDDGSQRPVQLEFQRSLLCQS
jgi:Zn-dependent peptidase ImmA (M78 family)/DNA-binding XRE family transcriptional regulator